MLQDYKNATKSFFNERNELVHSLSCIHDPKGFARKIFLVHTETHLYMVETQFTANAKNPYFYFNIIFQRECGSITFETTSDCLKWFGEYIDKETKRTLSPFLNIDDDKKAWAPFSDD